jgi:hypothetical protein
MASADITVIPTGGDTPVDLADLAAAVAALQAAALVPTIVISHLFVSSLVEVGVAKATYVIETVNVYFDSDPTPVFVYTTLPDGLYGQGVAIPAPGNHTVTVTGATSGATVTGDFTV